MYYCCMMLRYGDKSIVMANEKFNNKYRIPTARKSWYNYNAGCFFVTICTKDMEYYFGNITDKVMILSAIGKVVQEMIVAIPQVCRGVEVLSYVVMPNHVHIIIYIHPDDGSHDDAADVSCGDNTSAKHEFMQEIATNMGRLSKVVNQFKGAVTKYARANGIPFAWQPRYYDEIIRDNDAFDNIKRYIETNVERWDKK